MRPDLLRLWAPVVVYMAVIFYLSSLSDPTIPAGGDKPWHLIGYTGFGGVVARAWAGGFGRRVGFRTAISAILFGVGYAITDEIHQLFVSGRSAELADLVADWSGVVLGTGACWACGIIWASSRDER